MFARAQEVRPGDGLAKLGCQKGRQSFKKESVQAVGVGVQETIEKQSNIRINVDSTLQVSLQRPAAWMENPRAYKDPEARISSPKIARVIGKKILRQAPTTDADKECQKERVSQTGGIP